MTTEAEQRHFNRRLWEHDSDDDEDEQDLDTSVVVRANNDHGGDQDPWKNFTIPFALVQEIVLLKRRSETLELHKRFSKSSASENEGLVLERISDVRRRARQFAAYTCVVEYLFAEPRIDRHFSYNEILSAATDSNSKPTKLIDVGCCVGTDVRKLITDGYPSENITAMDKESRFFDLGMKMYNQTSTPDSPDLLCDWITADLLSPTFQSQNSSILGSFDHVHSANVVHLFDAPEQVVFLRNLASLAKPGGKIWGRQVGDEPGSETQGVKIEGKGMRCTPLEFLGLLREATGWDGIEGSYRARLVGYDELRVKRDYKKLSLEWVVTKPEA